MNLEELRAEVNIHGVLDIDQAEELLDLAENQAARLEAVRAELERLNNLALAHTLATGRTYTTPLGSIISTLADKMNGD